VDGGEEVACGLLIACGDGTKLFDLGEEVLDQMACCIEFSIIVTRRGPISSRRDHRSLADGNQRLQYARIGVECLVCDQRIGLYRGQQVIRSL